MVQDESRLANGGAKDRAFFERKMAQAFAEGRRVLREDGVGCVVFAHKTTAGWEALLSGMTQGGWIITGSWPLATESETRLRARDSAALATSVHLICRPRPLGAAVGDWGDVLRELPRRVGDWMERLQSEDIRGADLVFACIGPALEIFSRYCKVETAEGREVRLPEFLTKVWEVIGRAALRQILGTDTPTEFDEDASLTALFLWTLRSTSEQAYSRTTAARTRGPRPEELEDSEEAAEIYGERPKKAKGGFALPYDIVRRFCQPLGIRLDRWEGRLTEIDKGVVRLLPITERGEQLLGKNLARDVTAAEPRRIREGHQLSLFQESEQLLREDQNQAAATGRLEKATWADLHKDTVTTLDHVQKAMLFQKQGQTTALRQLLFYEQAYRPEFLRLANALSALYPTGSEEKRLLDAMLQAAPR